MNHPLRFSTRENSLRVASGLIACGVLVGAAQATQGLHE